MFTDLLSTTRETWLILIAVATLTFAAYKLRSYHKLRHIPGPTWTGLSDIPHIRAFLSERCCEWYSSVSETHGKWQGAVIFVWMCIRSQINHY